MLEVRTIASSGPEPQKTTVHKSELPWLIRYQGTTYQIQPSELRNLALDSIDAVVKKAHELGQDPMPDFSKNCMFCSHNSGSFQDFFAGMSDSVGFNCKYASEQGVMIAMPFANKKDGSIVRAIADDCAFNDAKVLALISSGALKPYVVDQSFLFPRISAIEEGKVDARKYQIKGPSLIGILKGFFNFD